ncbi:MAG TPA: glycosyltransferase [Planctomycetota bacterium]|jgi:trehalose synthase|nr:glycosyltransferase [Planctomycetota bacterium]
MATLADYEAAAGKDAVHEIATIAARLKGLRVVNVNSTAVGGGVAEILMRMVPLLQELGVDARWEVIKGDAAFYETTKAMHNALHGVALPFTDHMRDAFLDTTTRNAALVNLDADVVVIHDPQPAGLVEGRAAKGGRWIWRCHIDLSRPSAPFWDFLRPFVERHDAAVFSAPQFTQALAVPQYMIPPSIDPLSEKNRELPDEEVRATLERFHLDPERPIVTQVSRFDRLKDPLGVIEAFQRVRKRFHCQLVLAGGSATDDPEGSQVLEEVKARAGTDPDVHILSLPSDANREINALQRGSTILVQKSLREGFGLTVTEAMWKGKPVVASAVGGIPLQVRHRMTGLLVHSVDGAARALKQLLANPAVGQKMGTQGREHVRNNFLLTRHVKDYLLLFHAVRHGTSGVVQL